MIQAIKYKCCDKHFAACIVPECYTDKDWLKDLRKYVLAGHEVEMVENGNLKFGDCKCKDKDNLFTETGELK
jgi:hypothetical protein